MEFLINQFVTALFPLLSPSLHPSLPFLSLFLRSTNHAGLPSVFRKACRNASAAHVVAAQRSKSERGVAWDTHSSAERISCIFTANANPPRAHWGNTHSQRGTHTYSLVLERKNRHGNGGTLERDRRGEEKRGQERRGGTGEERTGEERRGGTGEERRGGERRREDRRGEERSTKDVQYLHMHKNIYVEKLTRPWFYTSQN